MEYYMFWLYLSRICIDNSILLTWQGVPSISCHSPSPGPKASLYNLCFYGWTLISEYVQISLQLTVGPWTCKTVFDGSLIEFTILVLICMPICICLNKYLGRCMWSFPPPPERLCYRDLASRYSFSNVYRSELEIAYKNVHLGMCTFTKHCYLYVN